MRKPAFVTALLVLLGLAPIGAFAVVWIERAMRCVERGNFCTDRLLESVVLLLDAIALVGRIAPIGRARRGESSSAIRAFPDSRSESLYDLRAAKESAAPHNRNFRARHTLAIKRG